MTYAANANSRYLDGRVQTASQPELQLILLDGALRFGRQAEQLWNEPEQRAECEHLLTRTNDIVEALIQRTQSSRLPVAHGMPGTLAVEVERLSPLALVLRAAGQALEEPSDEPPSAPQ